MEVGLGVGGGGSKKWVPVWFGLVGFGLVWFGFGQVRSGQVGFGGKYYYLVDKYSLASQAPFSYSVQQLPIRSSTVAVS